MRITLVLTAGLLCVATFVGAQAPVFLPAPELTNLSPLGAQAGTTAEVTVSGQHLDGASALVFADASITSEPKKDANGKVLPNIFLVHLPDSVKPGVYDARVRGKFGISNPRRFCISTLPETILASTQSTQGKATVIGLNTVTNAATTTGARSWFKFHAAAKQRIFARVESPDTRFDSQLALSDAAGHGLQRMSGNGTLDFIAANDGDYFIEMHDLLYRGGADSRFRLVISDKALPTQRTDMMSSAFTSDAEITRIDELAIKSKDVVPHDLPLTPPCEFVSIFPLAGQAASFIFNAKKNDVFWLDVISHRLGHATDPALVVEKIEKQADGTMKATFIAEAPDMEFSASAAGFDLNIRDGELRFEAKEDGLYRVKLRDLFNTAPNSARLPYRLSIRKVTPDFQLVTVPDQIPRARPAPTSTYLLPPTLRRGGVASVRVFVQRQDGFDGDIALSAGNLPDGVTCLSAVLGNGDECASLTFYASDNAAPWTGFVRVIGTAKMNGQETKRIARSGNPVWTVNDTRQDAFRARLTDGLALAVIADEAPMLIEPETSGLIEAKANEKLTLKLKVTRRGGYDDLVKVRAFVLGEQDRSAAVQLDIPAKALATTLELDLAKFKVKPGEHTFVLHGAADRVKYKKNADEIPAAESELKKQTVEAAAALEALKNAQEMLAAAKQKPDKAAIVVAENELKMADTKSKAAAQAKTEAEKRVSDLTKQALPKDMTFAVFSKPVHIRIMPDSAKKP